MSLRGVAVLCVTWASRAISRRRRRTSVGAARMQTFEELMRRLQAGSVKNTFEHESYPNSRSSNSILRDVFARRAQAFHRSVFDDQFDKLTGAILSIGDYS